MSDKIKPSEVSEILVKELQGINSEEKFDEVGTVLTVGDGVARVYGLRNAEANELLEFENGTMAIVMNLEEDNSHGAILKFKQLVGFSIAKTIDTCYTVADGQYATDFIKLLLRVDALKFFQKNLRHLTWFNFI